MSKSWPKVRLGEVLHPVSRPVSVQPDQSYREIGIRSHGKGVFHKEPVTGLDLGDKKVFWMQPGDFVVNIVFAWEGAFALLGDGENGMIASHRFPCFRADESRLDLRFLIAYFRTPDGLDLLARVSPGGAGRNRTLSKTRMLDQVIPLPSIGEQQRIVKRIADITEQFNEARILHSQSRKCSNMLSQNVANFVLSNNTSPVHALKEILAEPLMNGLSVPASLLGSGVAFAKVGAVNTGTFDPKEIKLVAIELAENSPYWLRPGDLVVSRGNSSDFVGRAAVYQGSPTKCAMPDLLIRVRLEPHKAHPQFVAAFFQTSTARQYIASQISGTSSTMPKISQSKLEAMPVPVPPLAEQRRIVAELDALQAQVDDLKLHQAETAAELDALLPAILDKAFKGQL